MLYEKFPLWNDKKIDKFKFYNEQKRAENRPVIKQLNNNRFPSSKHIMPHFQYDSKGVGQFPESVSWYRKETAYYHRPHNTEP